MRSSSATTSGWTDVTSGAPAGGKAGPVPAAAAKRERAPPAKAPAASAPAALHSAAGNQALQRLLGANAGKAQVAAPGDAAEHTADRVAAGAAMPARAGAAEQRRWIQSTGRELDTSVRMPLERRFRAPLGDVRVHTGTDASAAATALNARAFTVGRDIVFGGGEYAPHARSGHELLLHELAHTQEPARDVPFVFRRPGGGPDPQPDAGGGDPPKWPEPESAYAVVVEIDDPSLDKSARERDKDKQKFALHAEVKERSDARFYIVPVPKLKPPATPAASTAKPPAPAPTPPPAPTALPDAAAALPSNPDFPAGSKATTIDGATLTVLGSTPEHVIVGEYNKYAVGAASTSALKLADGSVIIIDAGVNAHSMGITGKGPEKILSKLTLEKLKTFVGKSPVREFLISHAHSDHMSLAVELMREFPIETIRINSVQTRWPAYEKLREDLVKAQAERIEAVRAKFVKDIEAERAAWHEKVGKGLAAEQRELEWRKHVEAEFIKRTADIPGAAKARERVLVQAKSNVLDVYEGDLVPRGEPDRRSEKGDPDKVEFGENDPYRIHETQGGSKNERVLDQKAKTNDSDIDANATSYIIDLPSGLRLIVAPDLRANDLARLTERFSKVMSLLKKPARVQMWDITHHMQKGFAGAAVSAAQFSKIVDFLYTFHNKQGADVVVVSVEANLANPTGKTLVDPANIWLLRSLGFEAYLATSGRDVRVLDIKTSQNNRVTGIIGAKAPGTGPKEISIKRAKAALQQIDAQLQTEYLAAPPKPSRKKSKTPVPEPTADEKAAETARLERVKQLEARHAEIEKAYQETLTEITKMSQAPGGPDADHTTKSITDAGSGEHPKQKLLDEILEKYNYDRPVTSDLRLTEMALVVLNQDVGTEVPPPGSAAARARDLAGVRTKIYEIQARVKAGDVSQEIQLELIGELTRYKKILADELNPSDPAQAKPEGSSRTVLQDDLATVNANLEKLGASQSQTEFKRDVATGVLAEQEVIVIKPTQPSKGVEATGKALDAFGRGMGAVMIITTIHGQLDLIDRLRSKQANSGEAVLGTMHNLLAGAVAVRMVRGLHVGLGTMAVMSVLDFSQALARDYETDEQRNIEVAYSAITNTINFGVMAAGMAIARIPHPATMIAGTLITVLGPMILEKTGLHAWLERKLEFNPASVTQVKQSLRDLMNEYHIVIGSAQLAQRTLDAKDTSVVGDRASIEKEARQALKTAREKAAGMEPGILAEFETAYAEALEAHSGLKDLDLYRSWFMSLRHSAGLTSADFYGEMNKKEDERQQMLADHAADDWTGEAAFYASDEHYVLTPEQIDERFADIDKSLTLDTKSEDGIRAMPMWGKLTELLDKLDEIVKDRSRDDYHKKVEEYRNKVQMVVDNANYRLNPHEQSDLRTSAMLKAGSPGYTVFKNLLAEAQTRFAWIQHSYVENTMALCGVSLHGKEKVEDAHAQPMGVASFETIMDMAEGSLKAYRISVSSNHGPDEELVRALSTDSGAGARYREFIAKNPWYATEIARLQLTQKMIRSMLDQAGHLVGADAATAAAQRTRLNSVELELRALESLRMAKQGMYYESELEGLKDAALAKEVKELLPLFGKDGEVAALTPDELTALIKGDYGDPGVNFVPPLATRLGKVAGGLNLDKHGNINNVYVMTGTIDLMVGVIHRGPPKTIDASANVLVGAVMPMGERPERDGTKVEWVKVMPLNDEAIRFFGGYQLYDVSKNCLAPMNVELLKYRRDNPALTTPLPP